jgi:hypothetical protein
VSWVRSSPWTKRFILLAQLLIADQIVDATFLHSLGRFLPDQNGLVYQEHGWCSIIFNTVFIFIWLFGPSSPKLGSKGGLHDH